MGQEFCIYPKACMAEVQGIEQEIAKLVSCEGRLDGLKNSIGQNSSGSYRNIAEAIRGIAEAVRQEQEQLTAWKNALEKSVAQYQSTESTIAKGISDYNSTVKDKINTFEDTIIGYEDFTDSELYKIIDDLIEIGILDEDVLQALITMWNGTYLTSNKIGNTMTPIATTAPAPNVLVKIRPVTIQSSTVVTNGLSPPSSTVLRIMVDATPVFTKTCPNQLPKITTTAVAPQLSGPPWNTVVCASSQVMVPPSIPKATQTIAMTKNPIIKFPPFTA